MASGEPQSSPSGGLAVQDPPSAQRFSPQRTMSASTAGKSPGHQRQTSRNTLNTHVPQVQPNDTIPSAHVVREKPRRRATDNNGAPRLCGKCNQPLTGQFVRALGDTYHLECFTCEDCGKVVASKFFPVPDNPPGQYPLCETDYFRRLDLLCHTCHGALRGSYITALERKYHIEHFTCSVCPTVFGAQDSYYEHQGLVYCHYHYSTKFAQKCNGCHTAILQQFVEIFRNGQNQHWHPECYMIHKYWNVRLHQGPLPDELPVMTEVEATAEMRKTVRAGEQQVEEKVLWIWRTLSSFEEKSASSISDMLLHVSNGAYLDGVMTARKFILHVDVLFGAADDLDKLLIRKTDKGLAYAREAKLLCRKVISFFQLLSTSQDNGIKRLGVTQELLSLVTGLAHYLKLLIRICLQGALKYEREVGSAEGLNQFLGDIGKLDSRLEAEVDNEALTDRDIPFGPAADLCAVCRVACEDRSFKRRDVLIHSQCFKCNECKQDMTESPADAVWNQGSRTLFCGVHAGFVGGVAAEGRFVDVSRLRQYIYLLRVAHARLLSDLQSSGVLSHVYDDPQRPYRLQENGQQTPPLLRTDIKSRAGQASNGNQGTDRTSTYEQTVNDIQRLRSTRVGRQLSNTTRKPRQSTIIDAPNPIRPGSPDANDSSRIGPFQIIEDRDTNTGPMSQLNFGNNDAMTLDDIPRLVQAQQTREQRPNAAKYARSAIVPQEPKAKLVNGTRRESAGGPNANFGSSTTANDKYTPNADTARGAKRYFSELSALEYFVVRTVAVLYLEPLLDGHFTQEELLDLIETKRPTFWGKFGKAFKADANKANKGKKKGVFGVPLEQLVERDYYESTDGVGPIPLRIPNVVQDAIAAMRLMDMSVEGVFRKNGNINRLNNVRKEIDDNVEVDLQKENPVQVAALLKRFFRDMPEPLMTTKLHKLWVTTQKITDDDKRRRILHLTCCLLPKAHRDTMEVLFAFLIWVSSFSHVDADSGSKMDIHNLATVITPNILHPDLKKVSGVDDSFLAIEAVNSLIELNEIMSEIPEDLPFIINDSSLFSANGELTTKEILKRYGDRVNVSSMGTPNPGDENAKFSSARSRDGVNKTNLVPVATRVDTDPSQANAWSNESSVRHVAGGGNLDASHAGGGSSGPNSGLSTPRLPYSARENKTPGEPQSSPGRSKFTSSSPYGAPSPGLSGPGSGGAGLDSKSRVMGVT